MKNTLGTIATRRKLTGKFYFTPTGESGAIDFGNVALHKRMPKITRTQFKAARKGFVQTIDEEVSELEDRFQINGNEHSDESLRMQLFADRGDDVAQVQADGVTGSITNVVQGRSYFIGAVNVTGFTCANSITEIEFALGADYVIDLGSGMLTVVIGGAVDADSTINITFNRGVSTRATYTGPKVAKLARPGNVRFVEFDQISEEPRSTHTFPATIGISAWGQSDGQKETEFTFDLLITGDVVSDERVDA